MQLEAPAKKQPNEENLIPLINIVFLILIFFLVAATIRPFEARDIKLASSQKHEKGLKVQFALMINKEGTLTFKGKTISMADLKTLGSDGEADDKSAQNQNSKTPTTTTTKILTLIADKELPAEKLLTIVAKLEATNFTAIKLVTEETK